MQQRVIIKKSIELLKAKYLRRWRGKDGKWRYAYANKRTVLSAKDIAEEKRRDAEELAKSPLESVIKECYNWILEKTGNKFEAMVLLDENGNVLKTKLGDKSSIDVTDIASSLSGGIFLHNHPNGGSFSDMDIICAVTTGMKEIRAFGDKYEYIFRPKDQLPTAEAMHDFFATKDKMVRDKLGPLVIAGTMTSKDASMTHWHEIMTGFVKEFGGFYERRKTQLG